MTSSNPGEGSLRLVGGATNNTGVLQVYLNGTWVGICANGIRYDNESLEVACRQLGYRSWHSAGSVYTYNVHYYYYCVIICSNTVCSNVYECIILQCSMTLLYTVWAEILAGRYFIGLLKICHLVEFTLAVESVLAI